MAEPYIRAIREADVVQIHEIEKLCFAMPWSEESILHDVKENVVARWLVLDSGEGEVLAYAGMWFVLDEAHVCNVAVHPDHRRRGYGRRIFEALEALALLGVADLAAHAARVVLVGRHEHEVAAGDGEVGGHARALCGYGAFRDLHGDLGAGREALVDFLLG